MEIINSIFNNYLFLLFALFVIGAIIVNIVSSGVKKGGDIALESSKSVISVLWSSINKILTFIKDIFSILFLLALLLFSWITKKK